MGVQSHYPWCWQANITVAITYGGWCGRLTSHSELLTSTYTYASTLDIVAKLRFNYSSETNYLHALLTLLP